MNKTCEKASDCTDEPSRQSRASTFRWTRICLALAVYIAILIASPLTLFFGANLIYRMVHDTVIPVIAYLAVPAVLVLYLLRRSHPWQAGLAAVMFVVSFVISGYDAQWYWVVTLPLVFFVWQHTRPWRTALVFLLVVLTFCMFEPWNFFVWTEIRGESSTLLWVALLTFPLLIVASAMHEGARWAIIAAVVVLEVVSGSTYGYVRVKESVKARAFLQNIEQLSLYSVEGDTEESNGKVSIPHDSNTRPSQNPNSSTGAYVVPPKETKSLFSHATFHMDTGNLWKGSRLGIAKMRDGTERHLKIALHGSFFKVAGLEFLVFEFNGAEIGKWNAIQ